MNTNIFLDKKKLLTLTTILKNNRFNKLFINYKLFSINEIDDNFVFTFKTGFFSKEKVSFSIFDFSDKLFSYYRKLGYSVLVYPGTTYSIFLLDSLGNEIVITKDNLLDTLISSFYTIEEQLVH